MVAAPSVAGVDSAGCVVKRQHDVRGAKLLLTLFWVRGGVTTFTNSALVWSLLLLQMYANEEVFILLLPFFFFFFFALSFWANNLLQSSSVLIASLLCSKCLDGSFIGLLMLTYSSCHCDTTPINNQLVSNIRLSAFKNTHSNAWR